MVVQRWKVNRTHLQVERLFSRRDLGRQRLLQRQSTAKKLRMEQERQPRVLRRWASQFTKTTEFRTNACSFEHNRHHFTHASRCRHHYSPSATESCVLGLARPTRLQHNAKLELKDMFLPPTAGNFPCRVQYTRNRHDGSCGVGRIIAHHQHVQCIDLA